MSPMTSALISYWHRLPAESPFARRKTLDAIRERVRAGLEPRSALVPFALGDVDDGIVVAATQAYVAAGPGPAHADALTEATEWVRRGLALNRGAVFGALLALEDGPVVDRLAALRLVLSAAEVETVGRVLGPEPGARVVAFLQDWADLVASDPALRDVLTHPAIAGSTNRARAA
jgi:hypothetical protein